MWVGFVDRLAVRASMIFEGGMAVYLATSGEPFTSVLDELLVLFGKAARQGGMENIPGDETARVGGPLELCFEIPPILGGGGRTVYFPIE